MTLSDTDIEAIADAVVAKQAPHNPAYVRQELCDERSGNIHKTLDKQTKMLWFIIVTGMGILTKAFWTVVAN